jgi:hypothetical protein
VLPLRTWQHLGVTLVCDVVCGMRSGGEGQSGYEQQAAMDGGL